MDQPDLKVSIHDAGNHPFLPPCGVRLRDAEVPVEERRTAGVEPEDKVLPQHRFVHTLIQS